MKTLQDVMDQLTYLKAESVAISDPFGRSPVNCAIRAIDITLQAVGVKWHYDYSEDRRHWVAVLDDNPT